MCVGFGFNGQEKSPEIADGHYTAQYWEYDSRIGRRWNVDPRPNISMSPYSVLGGNPIYNRDPKGDTLKPSGSQQNMQDFVKMLGARTGNEYLIDKQGNIDYANGRGDNSTTTSSQSSFLGQVIDQAIRTDKNIPVDLVRGDDNIYMDLFVSGQVDLDDLDMIGKAGADFQAGMLGHILEERMAVPHNYGYSILNKKQMQLTNDDFKLAHQNALVVEQKIVTEMNNINYDYNQWSGLLWAGAPTRTEIQVPTASANTVNYTINGQQFSALINQKDMQWNYGNGIILHMEYKPSIYVSQQGNAALEMDQGKIVRTWR